MADYSQVNDYTAKDALSSGDPLKLIKGSDMDAELSAISAAIATKFDNTDVASAAEAQAATSNTVVMTPGRMNSWADNQAGIVADLQLLTDPNADRILFWDDSAGTTTFLTVSTGLSLSGTTLTVDESGFTSTVTAGNGLSGGGALGSGITLDLDYNELTAASVASGDLISFADVDDSNTVKKITFANLESTLNVANLTGGTDMSTVTLTAGSGLSYSSGGTDLTASATIDLDVNELTEETTVDGAADYVAVYDASAGANRKVLADAFVGDELGDGKWYVTSGSASSTESTIAFDTEDYDSLTRGTFNTTTGEYTVGSAGARILVAAQMRLSSQNAGSDAEIKIQKNGSNVANGITTVFSGYGASDQITNTTTTISCSAGDVIRVRAYCDTTESYGTGTSATFVSIVELA